MRDTLRRLCSSLVLLLAATAAMAQSESPGPLPGVFGEVLDVRVVNLEVVVTDKDGVPILGLGAGDFRLVVDGEEVPIDYFNEVRGGVAVEQKDVVGVPTIAPGKPVETSYLIFIDEFFSIRQDRNRVLDSLIEDLALMGPEDRMAVVAFNGRRLEMLSTWSRSLPELTRVLKRAKERPSEGLKRISERRQVDLGGLSLQDLFGDVGAGDDPFSGSYLDPEERFFVQRLSEQVDMSVAAAAATLRSFAKPPGRKVMMLMSGGWPFFPAEFLLGDIDRIMLDRVGLEGENLFRRLTDTANLLGYTLYTVDVPGLDREIVNSNIDSFTAPLPGAQSSGFFREHEVHFSLDYLAKETGGKSFLNARRTDAFEGAVSDTRSYYWLGFSPTRAWDDKRHDVRVEVRDASYRLRTRGGFLDSSKSREVTMEVESALLFGNAPTSGPLDAKLGDPRKKGRFRMEVPLEIRIPLDQVTFLPVGEGFATQLELRIAVIDESNRRAEVPVIPILLESPVEPTGGQTGRYETSLQLRRKPHQAVVAVYDAVSGRIMSASVEIVP